MDQATLLLKLHRNKEEGFNYQRRRHPQWSENYELYRDTVIVNRIIQRQSVNIPLMKETIRTIQTAISEPRDTTFEELDNDKQKEIFLNEYWKWFVDDQRLVLKDIVDKKQDLLYGRTFRLLNVVNGKPTDEIWDPQDVLVDRYADPADLDTANYIILQHIYRTLEEVANNDLYDPAAVDALKTFFASDMGLMKANENEVSRRERNDRMRDMGVPDIDNPQVGQVIVELNWHFLKLWDKDKKKYVIHVAVKAEDQLLTPEPIPLDDPRLLGKTEDDYWQSHYSLISWADDLERTDIWSDAWADVVRTPNKILNAWFSQMVENRTLKGMGMNYYDASLPNFVPQSFEPTPWGWVPVPVPDGKHIADVFQKVDFPDIGNDLGPLNFIIQMVETATAANRTEKGAAEDNDTTLGEIKLIAAKAEQRISSISTFYLAAQQEYGMKWLKLIEGSADKLEPVKVWKKGASGRNYNATIKPSDWKSKVGYRVKVQSAAEKSANDVNAVQKLAAIKQFFSPNNAPLQRILQNKAIDMVDLTPEETKEVMDFEQQAAANPQPQPGAAPGQPAAPSPVDEAIAKQNAALASPPTPAPLTPT